MQPREQSTVVRPARRRGARARNRVFGMGRRRSDAWDVRALSLPEPLLTAAPAEALTLPPDEELEDTAEWADRPVRSIDISDGPKLIHRPDPPKMEEPPKPRPKPAPPKPGPPKPAPPKAPVQRTADTPFPPKQRPKPLPRISADPGQYGDLRPQVATAPEPRAEVVRPMGAVGGRTQVPDPVRLLTEAPRTAEAVLAVVLWVAAMAVARATGAPAAAWLPLSAIPVVGLLALALPGGPAARTARALALLTAGAGLSTLSPDLGTAALMTAAGVAVVYPSVAGARQGRFIAGGAALSLLIPPAVNHLGFVVPLVGSLLVLMLGTHAITLQRALVRAVTTALIRDRSARRAAEHLEHARAHDAATGLATRDTLLRNLTMKLETQRATAVLVIDIERFSAIADHHGAAIADQVAEEVGRRISDGARLARSQFAILVQDASPDRCAEIARTVGQALEDPIRLKDREITVTASIGAAISSPALCTATDLVQGAEEAMKAARKHGTARWILFDPSLRAAAQARVALEEDLRAAVRQKRIETVFQPVLALGTGQKQDNCADDRIVGAEALPRWVRADDTEIDRAVFQEMAATLGLDRELGLQVVDQALDALVAWRLEGIGVDQIWVSIPPSALADRGFAHELTARLAVRGLPTSSVVVQIKDAENTESLGLLRSLGIAVALDGVGAGGTSLDALRRLPVSAVKLDMILTRELDRSDAVPRGISQLCRSLGLRVVMTGVETLEQLDGARRIAADAAQGHAIARPLSAEDITNLLTLRLPREFRL